MGFQIFLSLFLISLLLLLKQGGDIPKALDLCFHAGSLGRSNMFDVLTNIAQGLGADTSPQVRAAYTLF